MSVNEPRGAAESRAGTETPPYALAVDEVVAAAGSDAGSGLSGAEAAQRLASYGPNRVAAEEPPSALKVAAIQVA